MSGIDAFWQGFSPCHERNMPAVSCDDVLSDVALSDWDAYCECEADELDCVPVRPTLTVLSAHGTSYSGGPVL